MTEVGEVPWLLLGDVGVSEDTVTLLGFVCEARWEVLDVDDF